jgi:hypothetical protein
LSRAARRVPHGVAERRLLVYLCPTTSQETSMQFFDAASSVGLLRLARTRDPAKNEFGRWLQSVPRRMERNTSEPTRAARA